MRVTATSFWTESCCDYLYIGSTRYRGRSGPSNVLMTASSTLSWRTDRSVVSSGFVICGSLISPSPPPSSPSPPMPPMLPPQVPLPPAAPALTFTFDAGLEPGWTSRGWIRRSGRTPSYSTGPSSGHGGRGYYYYTEASGRSGRIDELSYDGSVCSAQGQQVARVNFFYHMSGRYMGRLSIVANGQEVWARSGDQGTHGLLAL